MRVGIPSASEIVTGESFYATPSWYTFFQNIYKAISGSLNISLAGMLSINTTSVSNTLTGETDLMTYLLPANSLVNLGSIIKIRAWGIYAANANNKTVKLIFGLTAFGPA
ncbi:MAG: hypothetical protein V4685_05045 [Bacteroidota bacterium]